MPLIKTIEVATSSPVSIEDAINQAVAEVGRTVRNIDSVSVKKIKASVGTGKVLTYDIECQISFRVDSRD
jgi:dodecin